MTVSNQSWRIMPCITTNAYKENDKLYEAVRYLLKPNIVNVNPQKILKSYTNPEYFKKYLSFFSPFITKINIQAQV